VVVQQQWLRDKFEQDFGFDRKKIIVSHPSVPKTLFENRNQQSKREETIFFFPSFPRVYKNFEVIIEATKILLNENISKFKVVFTINGKETIYSRWLSNLARSNAKIDFIGIQSREKVFDLMANSDCLIFPSRVETWGMPISEFKEFQKPLLVAKTEYSRETVGTYDKVRFFDPENSLELANLMKGIIQGSISFQKTFLKKPEFPYAENWEELFQILLDQKLS